MKQVWIGSNDAGQRLDQFLRKTFPAMPRSLLYRALRKKRIKLNGTRATHSTFLTEGDEITLYLNDDLLRKSSKRHDFLQADPTLQVVYEDDPILLVDKPIGVLVHPDRFGRKKPGHQNTLIHQVKHYLYQSGSFDPNLEHSFAPAPANRLDRNTSGIVLFAKTAPALRMLAEKIRSFEIEKHYLCICIHPPAGSHGCVTHFYEKDEDRNYAHIFADDAPSRKIITTSYTVLERHAALGLLDVQLHTGRSHQIRAHLAYLGFPLLGDAKYGNRAINARYGITEQLLCAYRVSFAFQSDAGVLQHLSGSTFETSAPTIWETWAACKKIERITP